jgi:hypothetical protein
MHDVAADETRPSLLAELQRLKTDLELPDWVEQLPRDPRMRTVPVTEWGDFTSVQADCTLHWVDDEDEPEQFAYADLISGTLEVTCWEFPPIPAEPGRVTIEYVRTSYSNLHLDWACAELILSDPTNAGIETTPSAMSLTKHTDEERREWIRQRGRSGGGWQGAFAAYKKHPRYDGTKQTQFRSDCREVWEPHNGGRPKSVKKPVRSA